MIVTNKERVGRALDVLHAGLKPFVAREMTAKFGVDWHTEFARSVDALDVAALLNCMKWKWESVFGQKLGNTEKSYVFELSDIRNRWAHQRPFTLDDAYRALDTAVRLLRAVSAPQAEEADREMQEIMRVRYEEQAKREQKPQAVTPPANVRADHVQYIAPIVTTKARNASRSYPLCECGCGELTAGGRFRPGHDGRLKGMLIRTARAEGEDKDVATCEAAWNRLVDLNWSYMFDEEQTRITAEMNRRKAARTPRP